MFRNNVESITGQPLRSSLEGGGGIAFADVKGGLRQPSDQQRGADRARLAGDVLAPRLGVGQNSPVHERPHDAPLARVTVGRSP